MGWLRYRQGMTEVQYSVRLLRKYFRRFVITMTEMIDYFERVGKKKKTRLVQCTTQQSRRKEGIRKHHTSCRTPQDLHRNRLPRPSSPLPPHHLHHSHSTSHFLLPLFPHTPTTTGSNTLLSRLLQPLHARLRWLPTYSSSMSPFGCSSILALSLIPHSFAFSSFLHSPSPSPPMPSWDGNISLSALLLVLAVHRVEPFVFLIRGARGECGEEYGDVRGRGHAQ
jgi:hypothetical protein